MQQDSNCLALTQVAVRKPAQAPVPCEGAPGYGDTWQTLLVPHHILNKCGRG
jgi:hypothetical protein